MSNDEKIQEIGELQNKASALEEQIHKVSTEARSYAGKRDKLNGFIRNLQVEIQKLRSRRDQLNAKVKELKQKREESKAETHEKTNEIQKLNQQVKVVKRRRPSRKLGILQKELEETEWEIQTTHLTLQEEKELVEHVRRLEDQISIHRKFQTLHQKILELQNELGHIRARNKNCHERLIETAQRSQETHKKMIEKIVKMKEYVTEADRLQQSFRQIQEKKIRMQLEVTKILDKIRLLKGEIRKEEEKAKEENEAALKRELKEKAREKLTRGEKLSWQEFQLLAEKGKATQD